MKLAPTEWSDSYQSRATCRNILIDLLESGDQPAKVTEPRKVSYRITAAAR